MYVCVYLNIGTICKVIIAIDINFIINGKKPFEFFAIDRNDAAVTLTFTIQKVLIHIIGTIVFS